MTRLLTLLLALLSGCSTMTTDLRNDQDPWLWLEGVHDERALAWVRERNARTETLLRAERGFDDRRSGILEVLDSKARIPSVTRRGGHLYNFWTDAANPRGLWRRTTLEQYRRPDPAWDVLLDIDALGRAEGVNWVFKGASCLGPDYERCLVSLSRGGADATTVREFDLGTRRFVEGGFVLPDSKTSATWFDRDQLLVATDFGPGSLTDSGYPRIVKRWHRGTPLAQAKTVIEGERSDVSVYAWVDHTPGFRRAGVGRHTGFYSSQAFLLEGDRLVPMDKPADAGASFWRTWLLFSLRSDWTLEGRTHPAGSLLVTDAAAWARGERRVTALFTPGATRSLQTYTRTRDTVLLDVLDDVNSRLEEWRHGPQGWQRRDVATPGLGTLDAAPLHDAQVADDPLAEAYWLTASGFLQPTTLMLARTGSDERESLKSLPAFFDATGMRTEQRFARSKDGTRVPYFIVWPRQPRADGRNPTLLYGYGGFEVAMQAGYSAINGRSWLAQGGVYVLANIRGGGEYGPAWHQAAVRERKQASYDDFAAVAADLIERGVTRPEHLGIQGGSNGGLLVGAVMLQRPELFNAVVCQVPLLDMQRYHRLLAGASWMDEYGNPDKPEDWAVLQRYSPYHNVPLTGRLPTVLLTTSTRDDRVHPGHARKMAARLEARGHPVLYWENIEGGHGGAADNGQRATMLALEQAFLWRQLAPR